MHTYLVALDCMTVAGSDLATTLAAMGARPVLSSAWVLPWRSTARSLHEELRMCLPSAVRVVIAEIDGDWHLE